MTIDDLIGAVRVTDPQLAPDGSRVLFVRTTTDLKSGKRNADIWVVPADGSAQPKSLIAGDASALPPHILPRKVTLEHYVALFTRLDLARYFFNSALITVLATLLSVAISSMERRERSG